MIEESQIQAANDAECDYDSSRFKKLSARDHVRMRYGMYIGDNGVAGLHHLAEELISNSIAEAASGHASQIFVAIHQDGSLSVEDDGRGIPVDRVEQWSEMQGRDISVLEFVMTQIILNVGSPFGLKRVNFLSRWCVATIWRGGKEYQLRFETGLLVGELQHVGATNKQGTRITMMPDPEIFETTEFQFDRMQARLRELACLHPGVRIHFRDERTKEFCFKQGISALVEELSYGRFSAQPEVYRLEAESKGVQFEVAFQFTACNSELIRTYVNEHCLPDGGTPVLGLQRAVSHVLREQQGLVLDRTYVASRCGLTAVIALQLDEPIYRGGTRDKVINRELKQLVETAVYDYLCKQFAADLQRVKEYLELGMKVSTTRGEINL